MAVAMLEYRLKDAHEFGAFFRGYRSHGSTGWWFRGQADADWKLIPKAGRPEFLLPSLPEVAERHLGRFKQWSDAAIHYSPSLPDNPWERLAVAQHHGLATCLMDWSVNALVALFFCCADCPDRDGAVYVYQPELFVTADLPLQRGAKIPGYGMIARSVTARIVNQRAVFSVHMPADTPIEVKRLDYMDHPNLARLIIPATQKREIMDMLQVYGIDYASLFPDLEGLSRLVNWQTERMLNLASKSDKSAV